MFPVNDDGATMPLYVECTEGAARLAELVRDRRSIVVPPGEKLSFASYFNAFPASYWRRWTIVRSVELRVQINGNATVTVYRSSSRGHQQRVASEQAGNRFGYLSFDLPLAPFGDGGWYWFEVSGSHEESTLDWAEWVVESDRAAQGRVTAGDHDVQPARRLRRASAVPGRRARDHGPDRPGGRRRPGNQERRGQP